ncbi:4553_t:CDS:1, partial [Gigaspora rosea]
YGIHVIEKKHKIDFRIPTRLFGMAFCSRLKKMRNTMEYDYDSYAKAIETIKEV